MGFSFQTSGDYKKTEKWLGDLKAGKHLANLDRHGKAGVSALMAATPVDEGDTRDGWKYRIERTPGKARIIWYNTNQPNGVPIAVVLQYGHGTGTGGYVEGRDYINPAMRSIFDQIAEDVWKEVRN
jgi:hypothetical protein